MLVRTSAGAPLADVSVSVDGIGLPGVTGPDGIHDFGVVPPDTYTVIGQRSGYSPPSAVDPAASALQTLNAAAGRCTQYELILDPASSISVHVQTPDETPIAGVTVSVEGREWHGVTGADGNFDFGLVPAATYTVVGEKENYDPVPIVATVASATHDVLPGASIQYILTLQPKPVCFAQLKYRPVDNTAAKLIGATHSFWYVRASDGTEYIISGGPAGPADSQKLNVWKDSDLNRASRPDKVTNATAWDSGSSPDVCAGVDNMIKAVDGWSQDTILYHPVSGPNSNSAARKIGQAGGFSPPRPPGAVSWDEPVQ